MDRPHTDSAGIARAGTTPCTGTRQQPLSDAVSAISHSKVSPWLCRCTGYQIASDSQCGFNLHFFFIEPSLFKRLLPPSPSSHPSPSSLNATRLHSTSPRPLSLVRSLAGSPPIPCSSSNAAPGGNHPPFVALPSALSLRPPQSAPSRRRSIQSHLLCSTFARSGFDPSLHRLPVGFFLVASSLHFAPILTLIIPINRSASPVPAARPPGILQLP
jgi:hypothetical protein